MQNAMRLKNRWKLVLLCLEPQVGWVVCGGRNLFLDFFQGSEFLNLLSMYLLNGVFHAVNH